MITTSTERAARLAFVFNLRSEDVRAAIWGSTNVLLKGGNRSAVEPVPLTVVRCALSILDQILFHLKNVWVPAATIFKH